MDPTTDPKLKSFIPVDEGSHFPIQNLPFGVYQRGDNAPRIGVRLGEFVVDVQALVEADLIPDPTGALLQPTLNAFMAAGHASWRNVRGALSMLLREDESTLRDSSKLRDDAIVPVADVRMRLPCRIGDYTDFYSSREHATNVGTMFRGKDNALLPNWLHLPVGYHGRSSSIVVSGTDLHRPHGQTNPDDAPAPTFGPSRMVDFELEMGFLVGEGNELGTSIPVDQCREHIFGMVLVNDWSARDIQKWEYVPLGPFLAKNFGTSISPWVVMLDALAPFQVDAPAQDPRPLRYLTEKHRFTYDIKLEVAMQSAKMRQPHVICRSNFKNLYWTIAQQLAHHTVNGCNTNPGDMMASGTISGPTEDSFGSMLELAWKGTKPLTLPNGEKRGSIQDGDRVTMTGFCENEDHRIGFGEVTGTILPAVPST